MAITRSSIEDYWTRDGRALAHLTRQFAKFPDEIQCLLRAYCDRIDPAQLLEKRFGQRGEKAVLERSGRLGLADRAGGGAGIGAVLLFEEGEDLSGAVEHGDGDPRQARDV